MTNPSYRQAPPPWRQLPSARVWAPVAVVAGALVVMAVLILARPEAKSTIPERALPLVSVVEVSPGSARLTVSAHGTVEPRTESELVAEVSGRIVSMSPELTAGGFFEEGDVLARIDARDYRASVEAAGARVDRARSELAFAAATLERQRAMRETGTSSPAQLDDAVFRHAAAESGLREAEVSLTRARLDLERTAIRTPFAGRVRAKKIDIGQFVNRGTEIARIFATDVAEVRLPVHDEALAILDLDRLDAGEAVLATDARPATAAPETTADTARLHDVLLEAEIGGRAQRWQGRIVRSEGALDERTRMLGVVARIEDPYAKHPDSTHPPLRMGVYVRATLYGRQVEGTFKLPRTALWRSDTALVVDADDRIRMTPVEVLKADRDHAWVGAGLAPGDRVVVSSLDEVTEGMHVRTVPSLAAEQGGGLATADASPGARAR